MARLIRELIRGLTLPAWSVAALYNRIVPIADRADTPGIVSRRRFDLLFRLAPLWRATWRWLLILGGLSIYFGAQFWVATEIVALQWWFILGAFMFAAAATLAFGRPIYALVTWLVLSPVVSPLFSLDWGSGLPALTFDRAFIYMLAFFLAVKTLADRKPPVRAKTGEILLLAFPFYIILTSLFIPSTSPTRFLLALMVRAGDVAILYYVARASVTQRKHLTMVIGAIVLVGFYSAVMGIFDRVLGRMSLGALVGTHANLVWNDAGGRSVGPFIEPGPYGMVLSMAMFLAFFLIRQVERKSLKLALLGAVGVMFVGWFYCLTRSAYIMFFVWLLFMPFLAARSRAFYTGITATVVFGVVVSVLALSSSEDITHRLFTADTAKWRIATNTALINMFKERPFSGFGLDNAEENMAHYAQSVPGTPGLNVHYNIGIWTNQFRLAGRVSTHHTYLVYLAEHGIVGVLIYFGCLGAFIAQLWKIRRSLSGKGVISSDLASIAILAIVGIVLANNLHNMDNSKYIMYLMWILIAIVLRGSDLMLGKPNPSIGVAERDSGVDQDVLVLHPVGGGRNA